VREFAGLCRKLGQEIYPFSLQLAIKFDNIYTKDSPMEDNMKMLLSVEQQILNGNLIAMKMIEELGSYSQRLHVLS
jgi:hypothetical protein